MKSRILLLVPLALLALSIALPAKASPAWYVEAQLEITGFIIVGPDPEGRGLLIDVPFEGVAGGPNIKEGTVEGVDHVLLDLEGIVHLNVSLTITDMEGDKISAHVTGRGVAKNPKNPSQLIFENAEATIINELGYPTTGKYIGLVGYTLGTKVLSRTCPLTRQRQVGIYTSSGIGHKYKEQAQTQPSIFFYKVV